MPLQEVSLNEPGKPVALKFNPARPFCRLNSVLAFRHAEKELLENGFKLFCNLYLNNSEDRYYTERIEFQQDENYPQVYIKTKLNLTQVTKLEVYYETGDSNEEYWNEMKVPIRVFYNSIDYIDVLDQIHVFEKHLNDNGNNKILFSGSFGQGKSTFLDHFFDKNRTPNYLVFKLYPVNYAVASNEDIFKYIKSDILLQLMESNVDFENIGPSFETSFKEYFVKNPHVIIGAFLRTIPKIGKNAQSLFDALNKIKDDICLYHEKAKNNELKEGQEFINTLIEQEGSIYEDNFVTTLIRNLLNQRYERLPFQKRVLVIDDLDRMDPDHIFRILNVFSAHYDTGNAQTVYEKNKFGFDKIILVCDYQNLYHIYKHRYGAKVDFKGYISKYFSRKIFHFDNTKNYEKLLDPTKYYIQNITKEKEYLKWFKIIILPLVEVNVVTIRDLIKMLQIPFQDIRTEIGTNTLNYKNRLHGSYWMPTIYLLDLFTDQTELIEGLKKLNLTHFETIKTEFDITECGLQFANTLPENKDRVKIQLKDSRIDLHLSGQIINSKTWVFDAQQFKNDQTYSKNEIQLSLAEYKEILLAVFNHYYSNRLLFLK